MKELSSHRIPLKQRGFTLVELLVVIAILGILMGLLFPSLYRSKERARSIKCLSNLRQINIALECYKNDYEGHLMPGELGADPATPVRGWAGLCYPYMKAPAIFCCPTDDPSSEEADGKKKYSVTYFLNANLGVPQFPGGFIESRFSAPSHTVLITENTGGIFHSKVELGNPSEKDSAFANEFTRYDMSPYNRHLNGRNFIMADGHGIWLLTEKVSRGTVTNAVSPTALSKGIAATFAY